MRPCPDDDQCAICRASAAAQARVEAIGIADDRGQGEWSIVTGAPSPEETIRRELNGLIGEAEISCFLSKVPIFVDSGLAAVRDEIEPADVILGAMVQGLVTGLRAARLADEEQR